MRFYACDVPFQFDWGREGIQQQEVINTVGKRCNRWIRAKQWMKGANGLRITTSKIPACFSLYNLESVYFCSLVIVRNVTPRIDFRIKSKREGIEFLPKWSTISGSRKGSKVRVLIPFCARILEKFAHTCTLNRISRVTNYKEKTSNPCLPLINPFPPSGIKEKWWILRLALSSNLVKSVDE